jgi:Fe-S oxidoreductase
MMAARRWLTTEYDWTRLAKRLYLSEAWEIGALSVVALGIIMLFWFFHGPIITDRVAVNSFAPVLWIEIGDLVMAAVLSAFLLSNAFRMYRFVMAGSRVPFRIYLSEAKAFVHHFATQKQWRKCSEDKTRWLKHFVLVTGYMTMMTLIIGCIRWFQVDDSSWHFTSIFGYYATAVLLYLTVDMFRSRQQKKAAIHRFSQPTDWLFLVLLFFTTLSGILMHIIRLAGWPLGTYVMYVIHLAIAVPMLVIEVPFGKWSHLFYRPLAIFLTSAKEKAATDSLVEIQSMAATIGETFLECLQCGTCSGLCPVNQVGAYSPRKIVRQLALDSGTAQSIDQAVWNCVTCNACTIACPSGIDMIDITRTIRHLNVAHAHTPDYVQIPLSSLSQNQNPWNGLHDDRMAWTRGLDLPVAEAHHEYCLFTCCTTAYEPNGARQHHAIRFLARLMSDAGITFGTLGRQERCCGDPATTFGDTSIFEAFRDRNTRLFLDCGLQKILTTSPHCYHTFRNHYPGLVGNIIIEHHAELLERLIHSGLLTPVRDLDRIVTFHDPCYLGRHSGIYEAPRRVLTRIPGLTLVEMPNNRENSLCCGGGGGHAWRQIPRAERLSVLRVQEALSTGAEVIATACPLCMHMLDDAVRAMNVASRIKVRDLADLVSRSLEMKEEIPLPADQPDAVQEVCHV